MTNKTRKAPKKHKAHVRVRLTASRQAIARRYETGESLYTIAADYGVSTVTVRSIARALGKKVRPRGRPTGYRPC